MKTDKNDYYSAKLDELINLVKQFLPLDKWGFKLNATYVGRFNPGVEYSSGNVIYPNVYYNSEYCRVLFVFDKDRHGDDLCIYYGRLHAPDGKNHLNWNNDECRCWHGLNLVLKFLDGVNPSKVARMKYYYSQGTKDLFDSKLIGTTEQPEWLARLHAASWEYYGNHLFDLFDLRHPDLWNQYTLFVKEYYQFEVLPFNPLYPPPDNIC